MSFSFGRGKKPKTQIRPACFGGGRIQESGAKKPFPQWQSPLLRFFYVKT
jgi:hypothetical protein